MSTVMEDGENPDDCTTHEHEYDPYDNDGQPFPEDTAAEVDEWWTKGNDK